ncbi:unnamed protein product, partial [Allacma fusca]
IKAEKTSVKPDDSDSRITDELPSLVKYGKFCMQPPEFDVDGKPQNTPSPFDLEIFTLRGASNVNTLQLILRPKGITYHYMVMQAVNEDGIPIGMFHHYPCTNAVNQTKFHPTGINRIMNFCTMQKYSQDPVNKKYGNTNLMYTMYRPEEGHLEDAMVFWSWQKHLGKPPPRKIQFRYAAVKEVEGEEDMYWVMHSPIINFQEKDIYVEPDDLGIIKSLQIQCYTNKLSDSSDSNFALTKDNAEIIVNNIFLEEVVTFPATPSTFKEATKTSTSLVTKSSTGMPTLVKYHGSCKHIEQFQVEGIPESSNPPNPLINSKWGNTRMAYIIPNETAGYESLATESIFWSWSMNDGNQPKKIQFKVAAIHKVKNDPYLFWVDIKSPVIDVRDVIKLAKPEDFVKKAVKCYETELAKTSNRNFVLSSSQDDISLNKRFLQDLLPAFGKFIHLLN